MTDDVRDRLAAALRAFVEYERQRHQPSLPNSTGYPPSLRPLMRLAEAALAELEKK